MTVTELEQKWKLIVNTGSGLYRSLRISADCIPDVYIALDIKGNRFMMLQVPSGISVHCPAVTRENLSLEWYEEKRFILIGLRDNRFEDLYNELILSLYNRIYIVSEAAAYTEEFINGFHKWAEFFDDTYSVGLSEQQVKGLFGELFVLKDFVYKATPANVNGILEAWKGPYERAHDFDFSDQNLEVKTKDVDQVSVRISSEYQLQPDTGKAMRLGIVDLLPDAEGQNLSALITEIKSLLIAARADMALFYRTLSRAGIGGGNVALYDFLKWNVVNVFFYDCDAPGFPKITASRISDNIRDVKYNLVVSNLKPFIILRINL